MSRENKSLLVADGILAGRPPNQHAFYYDGAQWVSETELRTPDGNIAAQQLVVMPGGASASLATVDQRASPPVSLQALIDAASSGSTVELGPYVYRGAVSVTGKDLTLQGVDGQTSIRASDVWDEDYWHVQAIQGRPEFWRSTKALPTLTNEVAAGLGASGSTRALLYPDQVFRNHLPLRRAAKYRLPQAGEYGVDASGHVVLADDPTGDNLVEVTNSQYILQWVSADLTLRNIDFRHAASLSVGETAGVRLLGDGGVLVADNCKFRHMHGIGLGGYCAPGSSITNCEFAYCGATGHGISQSNWTDDMTATLTQSVFANNVLHHNGHLGYDWIWGAGGTKWSNCNNWWIHHNEFHNNGGVGLWVDIHNTEMLMEFNKIHHNAAMGFCFEISGGKTVNNAGTYNIQFRGDPSIFRHNILYENDYGDAFHGHPEARGDVFISASENITVEENIIAWSYAPLNVYWNYTRGASQMPTGSTNDPNDIILRRNFVIGEQNFPNVNSSYKSNPLLSIRETGGTELFGSPTVGASDNRYWTRVYGNSSSIDGNASDTGIWRYNATDYNTLAGLNGTDGGRGPDGLQTASTLISTTNALPPPAAVLAVLNGTSALYDGLDPDFQAFVQANPLPTAPEAGHGYKPVGMYGPGLPYIVPVTATATLAEDDEFVVADATAGNVTLTLPVPRRRRLGLLYIKRTDNSANTLTITAGDMPGNDTKIDLDQDSITIAAKGDAGTYAGWLLLLCDGYRWLVMAKG
jgi:hypothetical protein